MVKKIIFTVLFMVIGSLMQQSVLLAQEDHTFYSKAFQSERSYRIYLPASYVEKPHKKYPVIYFFHGFGGRYKWQGNAIDFDAKQLAQIGKKRNEPPLIMEWRDYTQKHDVIIVTWDGYEPLYEPGLFERDGLRYGGCAPYDYLRAHEVNGKCRGWDFRKNFAELVAHVDSTFCTISDRAHRGVTGQSMGGLMSLYIGGQCKDLVSSVSTFCPADNIPLFGPLGKQAVFPILEMWRSLKGIPVRLTYTDGDWLIYNDLEIKRLWRNSDLNKFTFHEAHFPNHWAGDSDKQLDFHLQHFSKNSTIPVSWNYVAAGFLSFDQFGYKVNVERSQVALTLFNHINTGLVQVESRKFIPDGELIRDEKIHVVSDRLFSSKAKVIAYNLADNYFYNPASKSNNGKLSFDLKGGGNVVGLNCDDAEAEKIRLVDKKNRQYYYFEEGKNYSFNFKVVNVGVKDVANLEIRAISEHPYISILQDKVNIKNIVSATAVEIIDKFNLTVSKYDIESSVGSILFEIEINGAVVDTQKVVFFTTSKASYADKNDVIILDGRTVDGVPVFVQGSDKAEKTSISGGKGNGDGIFDRGEEALVYIRLAQGGSAADTNTFHKTYLLNDSDYKYLSVDLKYSEKIRQAGATSIFTSISLSDDISKSSKLDLWFKVESLFNEHTDVSDNVVYAHKYSYRRVKLQVEK